MLCRSAQSQHPCYDCCPSLLLGKVSIVRDFANRSALVVIPKEPFKEWAELYNEGTVESLSEHVNEKHVYLIEFFYKDNFRDILSQYYEEIFESELSTWNYIEDEWPKDRSIDMFLEWFDVSLTNDIFDLEGDDIQLEEVD